MAPPYQVTISYELLGSKWKEVFYSTIDANGQRTADQVVDTLVQALPGLALAFRHPFCQIETISVREENGLRLGAIREVGASGNGPTTGQNSPDVADVAALVSIGSAAARNRHMWLRGLNDALTRRANDTGKTISAPMLNGIRAYLGAIDNYGGATRVLTPPPNPIPIPPTILNWQPVLKFGPDPANSDWTQVYLPPGAPIIPTAASTYVYFKGLPNPEYLYLRGRFLVTLVRLADGTFSIPARWRGGAVAQGVRNVFWRQSTYTFSRWSDPTKIAAIKLTTRDTASPTGRRRGRRSPVIRRR